MKLTRPFEWQHAQWTMLIGGVCLAVAVGFLIAAFPPYLVIGGLAAAIAGVFMFRQPWWGILLIAACLPLERLGAFETGGLTVRLSQLFLAATAGVFMIRHLLRPRLPGVRGNYVWIPLLFFFAVNVLSLTGTINLTRSIIVLLFIFFTASIALILPSLISTPAKVQTLVRVLLVSFVCVSVFGLFQFVGDMSGLPTSVTGLRELYTNDVLGFTRVQSTAYEPLYFANYLLIPLSLLFAFFLAGRRLVGQSWLITLLGLGMVNLILTVSRGAYLAIVAALGIVALFYLKKLFTVRNALIGLVAIGLVGYVAIEALGIGGGAFTIDKFQEHVGNAFYGASYNERVETFDEALAAWHEHPWLGIGVGGFGPAVAPHPAYVPKDGWKIVNNEFIEILAESGLLGLIAFGALILALIGRSLTAIRRARDPFLKSVLIGLLGAFIGIVIQYQTFSTLYIMHVWFLISLMVAVQEIIFSGQVTATDDSPRQQI